MLAPAARMGQLGTESAFEVLARANSDPAAILAPSALAGACLLVAADLVGRIIPTEVELKLGVVTALFGAPLFALIAWRAARSWSA